MVKENNPFLRKDFQGQVVEEYSELTEDESDRLTLDHLRASGSDLTLPRHIVHHLYFDSAIERDQAAKDVRDGGYRVNAPDRGQPKESYLLRAERTGLADEESIRRDRITLGEIADQHNGEYDGWAAAEDS